MTNKDTDQSKDISIPKDYNIFDSSQDSSDMDYLDELFGTMDSASVPETNVLPETDSAGDLDTMPDLSMVPDMEEILGEAVKQEDNVLADNIQQPDDLPAVEERKKSESEVYRSSMEQEPVDKIEEETASMNDYSEKESDLDMLDLINQINNTEESSENNNQTADTQDDISQESKAADIVADSQIDPELLKLLPEIEDETNQDPASETAAAIDSAMDEQTIPNKKKRGLFAKVFGNIREDISEEEKERLKQQVLDEADKKEAEKQKKIEADKQKKAQKKADKEAKAKQAKEEADRKKKEKAQKAKAKKEEKEKRSREIQELIDEIDENEGKINKIGASVVFTMFAALAIVIVIGTNLYSYAVSMQNAEKNFNFDRYDEAYENVYGMDIREEDIEVYEKIMTVMFVNKQLDSYKNYCTMQKYPEALDSLIKGLERYEKYYMMATSLGIQSKLDHLKEQIIAELDSTFSMSESEADELLAIDDQAAYSEAVYTIALTKTSAASITKK